MGGGVVRAWVLACARTVRRRWRGGSGVSHAPRCRETKCDGKEGGNSARAYVRNSARRCPPCGYARPATAVARCGARTSYGCTIVLSTSIMTSVRPSIDTVNMEKAAAHTKRSRRRCP